MDVMPEFSKRGKKAQLLPMGIPLSTFNAQFLVIFQQIGTGLPVTSRRSQLHELFFAQRFRPPLLFAGPRSADLSHTSSFAMLRVAVHVMVDTAQTATPEIFVGGDSAMYNSPAHIIGGNAQCLIVPCCACLIVLNNAPNVGSSY
uniref:Uncharacterized protein n=1 Tax=Eutreptiella gymnastica TaxID=73025 RepID=A0A7S4GEM3_9EUGL|mmetsp:Transcript_77635/g.129610  ORF Transcript_77635/g.129610 Transcript_77635/m.129610 type:complete len:145 (-) Transcript_77635:460-894(-)